MFERRGPGGGLLALALLTTLLVVAPASPTAAAACEKQWTNPGTDGVWDIDGATNATETQWTPAGVPTATDTVCLAPGDYNVFLSSAAGPPPTPSRASTWATAPPAPGCGSAVRSTSSTTWI